MNLALSALLILLLLLPAFSFRLGIAIYSGIRKPRPSKTQDLHYQLTGRNVSKALAKLNFTETVFLFSLIPIILHLLSLLFLDWPKNVVKFDLLLNIFSGKNDILKNSDNASFQQDLKSFLLYSLVEAILGCLLGFLTAYMLMGKQWVMKVLMGNNIWYRLFSGASLDDANRAKLNSILTEVVVATKETTVIYSGILKNYETMPDSDQLSYLTLQSVSRRDLRAAQIIKKDPTSPTESITSYDRDYGPLINIPGHYLTIQGKDVINLNVTYLELVPAPTPQDPNAIGLVPMQI